MVYMGSLPIIAIITNVYPLLIETPFVNAPNVTIKNEEDEGLMLGVLLNQFVIFIIGGLGNFLTLLAIVYVRLKYGSMFSILQLNSVVLILHLSLADFLYAVLGLPNFLLVYLLREGVLDARICFYAGILRHLGCMNSYDIRPIYYF